MEAAALLRSPTATFLSLRSSSPSSKRSPAAPFARLSLSIPTPTLRRPISAAPRALAMAVRSAAGSATSDLLPKGAEAFFRAVISNMEKVYLIRNPTAKAVLDLVRSHDGNNVCYDHFAFRTFGEVIRKYIKTSGSGHKHAALASTSGCLTWEKPIYSDYQILSRASEYAAWTLVNGYAVNHVTISTHRLKSHIRSIKSLNQFIEDSGFKLNSDGGILKVSPDGLLQQSSTVADTASFTFADGVTESVPCSYIEFAERLLLPQYKDLHEEEVKEFHRRDGFEVGNADKIFESTSKDQLSRKVA